MADVTKAIVVSMATVGPAAATVWMVSSAATEATVAVATAATEATVAVATAATEAPAVGTLDSMVLADVPERTVVDIMVDTSEIFTTY